MKNIQNLWLIIIVVLLAISGCKDDENIIINPLIEKVSTSVFGTITDENGDGLSNVLIELEEQTTSSDSDGNFFFSNVSIAADNAFILAKKSGYFNGSRTFQPVKNSVNRVKIMLMEKGTAVMVDGANGGDAALGDGTKIKLPANGISKADGSIYSGIVSVYAKRLNPVDDDFEKMMPGDLIAEDESGEEQALETYGMVVVELEGSLGEQLNVAEGSVAEITLPLDPAIATGAPTTIPLWYFDESKGIWIEEGSATLVGDKYVGQVSHFSFWNCDAPFPIVKVTGTIFDGNTPLVNVLVKVSRTNGSPNRPVGTGYTDTAGVFCGKMPANESLLLEIFNQCNEVVYSETIGPFSEDQNLGNIAVDVSTNITEIIGTAVDCDGNAIGNASIAIKAGSIEEFYYGNGESFSIPFVYCNGITSIDVRVIDIDNELSSGWNTYPISGAVTDVATIDVCDELDEFVRFSISGVEYLLIDTIEVGLDGPYFHSLFSTYNNNNIRYSIFRDSTSGPSWLGDHVFTGSNPNQQQFRIGTIDNGNWTWYNADNVTLTYTAFGDVGELIRGTFLGTIVEQGSSSPISITGEVKVLRDY
ncbi:MAG: carboxypeptidase-like regulatory domain-containing protein [Chitinophagales bacterium]